MSKQRSKASKNRKTSMSRRKMLMIPVAAVAIGIAAFSIHAHDKNNRELHDLSVIGQGQPVIVQIHDPKCPTCKRLKRVVTNALKDSPAVHYRLADITKSEGSELQRKYNVPTITLLYFDRTGKHVHTSTGLQTSSNVQSVLAQIL